MTQLNWTVLKFVSEADLENYGATALPGEIGERTFEWSDDPAVTNTFNDEPLKDLDGNLITKAGWYDFTRRFDADGTSIGDGGEFIYANYVDKDAKKTWIDTDIRNFTEGGTIHVGLRLNSPTTALVIRNQPSALWLLLARWRHRQ